MLISARYDATRPPRGLHQFIALGPLIG